MNRLLVFLLLASLGLNVGLGLRTLRGDDGRVTAGERHGGRRLHGPEGPDGPREGEGPGRGFPGQNRFRGLDLSEEQEASLQGLRTDRLLGMQDQRSALAADREELRALLGAEVIDRDRVAAVRRRHGRLQAELDSLVTEQLLREMEILTPEQRRRYLERMPWRGHGSGGR